MYLANGWLSRLSGIPIIRDFIRKAKRFMYLKIEKRLWTYFPDDQVIGGPFKGIRFPHKSGNCSVFFPKLIGCYEAELHPIFDDLRKNEYHEIWDIGAADGYYAAGLACIFPNSKVSAWEASNAAAANCRDTCQVNGVSERVTIRGICVKNDLQELDKSHRTLLICDIEGHEMDLFDDAVVDHLVNADILIELHEKFRPGVTAYLSNLFSRTHQISIINAVADEEKVKSYNYPPLNVMNSILRRYATSERRYSQMQWLVARVESAEH
jgi:hypothetical protein